MRADAKRNNDRLLAVAGEVIAERGAEASLREIARRAGVGLGTMQRHFSTREALLEALLRSRLSDLTRKARESEGAANPGAELVAWLRNSVAFVRTYSGVVDLMAQAVADPASALHASCTELRAAGAELLQRAQGSGAARTDIDGVDLFALIGALGWISNQPAFEPRGDHLVDFIMAALVAA